MSKVGAPEGVVDPAFKVKGVSNLRVVDASVFVSNDLLVMEMEYNAFHTNYVASRPFRCAFHSSCTLDSG